MHNYNSY